MIDYLCSMPLTNDEKKFMEWWAENRSRQNKPFYLVWMGIPLGIAFALPILLNFLLGRYWYKRADSVGASQFNPLVLGFALILIIIFIGIFYKKHTWDQREQKYMELKAKKTREDENVT